MDYLDLIRSDLSVFHRVDDISRMPSRRFCELALLLPYYRGALRGRLEYEREHGQPEGRPAPQSPPAAQGAASKAVLALKYGSLIE